MQTGLVAVSLATVLTDLEQGVLGRRPVAVPELLLVPHSRLTGQAGSRVSHRGVTA
jgi:hypothetical protein